MESNSNYYHVDWCRWIWPGTHGGLESSIRTGRDRSPAQTLTTLVVISTVVAAVLYALRGEIAFVPGGVTAGPAAARHVGALLVLFFLLAAIRTWLVGTADLLSSDTGPLVGASYSDVHVALPGLYVAAFAAVAAAGVVVDGVRRGRLPRFALIAGALYVSVSLIARGLVPYGVQKLVVSANELTRERPYIEYHIAATRKAWGLDGVETRDLGGDTPLSMADIRANAPTIDNVRLWERDLLKQTFGQLQEIRTYYDFVSVNDDRYMIDGRYRQVHLAARELNVASLPTRTFINERFPAQYRHSILAAGLVRCRA